MEKLRIGIFGGGPRGKGFAKNFMWLNCEVVAVCERRQPAIDIWKKELGEDFAFYTDFEEFIQHDMDAVVLTNNFHEHARYAIRCLEKDLHVISECTSNATMAEGVALIRAAEKSKGIYFLAENYPQMIFNREMKRVVEGGTLGKILFAEGEYNHPIPDSDVNFAKSSRYNPEHWRHHLPSTYYITHALGPVMRITGATPKRVNVFNVFAPQVGEFPSANYNGDQVSIITTQNDDGSVFRIMGWAQMGAHDNSYRICGTKGQVENVRGMGDKVMLRYNKWDIPEGGREVTMYEPPLDPKDKMPGSGHGGSDYVTCRMFKECIEEGKQPEHPFDVHSAVTMASVAILGHRGVLEGGRQYDIPDFHTEEARKQYENDRQTPFYGSDGSEPNIPCCSVPDYKPTETQLKLFRQQVMGEEE